MIANSVQIHPCIVSCDREVGSNKTKFDISCTFDLSCTGRYKSWFSCDLTTELRILMSVHQAVVLPWKCYFQNFLEH